MNNDLKKIWEIYKPYKYTYKDEIIIIETTKGKYVIKKNENEKLKELYNYLNARNFKSYPEIKDEKNDYILSEYIENNHNIKEQKFDDLINLMSNLHNKTVYYKEINPDRYQSLYESLIDNINYLENYYDKLFDESFNSIYPSPSRYLLLCNYYLINNNLKFTKNKIDEWFNLVKDSKKQRVSAIHNNLSNKNYINKDDGYFINWDSSTIDSPILDFVNLYKNEYKNTNFEILLKKYNDSFPLLEEEKLLLVILLSIPNKVELIYNELKNTENINNLLIYINKTSELIRPYYSEEKKE